MEAMRFPVWSEGERRLLELRRAARFFTRVPLGATGLPETEPDLLARAAWAFPIVGALIGIGAGFVAIIAFAAGLPPLAMGLVAVGTGTLLTGALHEDGLADTVDGLGGGHDAAEKLAIMRDHRCGAYAVLALVFTVVLRAAAVSAFSGVGALAALVAAHVVGRGALPTVMLLLPPARTDGLAFAAGRPELGEAATAGIIAIVVALVALGLAAGITALIAAAVAMAALAWLAERQIGGQTGDILGAIEQGGETLVLLAAAAWAW